MKIRTDFVSNSSSSSFVFACTIDEFANVNKRYNDSFKDWTVHSKAGDRELVEFGWPNLENKHKLSNKVIDLARISSVEIANIFLHETILIMQDDLPTVLSLKDIYFSETVSDNFIYDFMLERFDKIISKLNDGKVVFIFEYDDNNYDYLDMSFSEFYCGDIRI